MVKCDQTRRLKEFRHETQIVICDYLEQKDSRDAYQLFRPRNLRKIILGALQSLFNYRKTILQHAFNFRPFRDASYHIF